MAAAFSSDSRALAVASFRPLTIGAPGLHDGRAAVVVQTRAVGTGVVELISDYVGELTSTIDLEDGVSLALRTEEIPHEEIIKAQTLGASTWQIMARVVVPQMMPRLIDSVRLSLGAAWLYLIAAEAIAAESGLGYRIFLMRRYLAMDVILPYVAWITLLAFTLDFILRIVQRIVFRWMYRGQA